jgi:D-aminoacyl-tRNA deacylase
MRGAMRLFSRWMRRSAPCYDASMRAVAQRVASAEVTVAGECVGRIARGLLVYLAAGKRDGVDEARWMASKLAGLRIFEDEAGRMSRDVTAAGSEILVVSQFTLFGDVRRGRRPSFDDAADPDRALELYQLVCSELARLELSVETGRFRAMMEVRCVVAGPVTILIDSEKQF